MENTLTSADRRGPFEAVVFAGGGCRCFWQVGFWEVAAPALGLRPRVCGAVSAGAAMACMLFAEAVREGLAYFTARVAANRRNIYPLNALARQPVFPHPQIYRDTILATLDSARLTRLHAGPDIRVLVALVPRWLGPRSGFLLGLLAYQAERLLMQPGPHGALGRRAGFEPEIGSVRDCRTAEEVADLIMHSSCTPPITPVYRRRARPVLDGGLIDSAPIETVPASSPTLILLTRPYPPASIPRIDGRVYVQPSEPVPIDKWDYTSPERVQATYDLGRRDGERFVARVHPHGLRACLESP